jgi:hypothetical protein
LNPPPKADIGRTELKKETPTGKHGTSLAKDSSVFAELTMIRLNRVALLDFRHKRDRQGKLAVSRRHQNPTTDQRSSRIQKN